MATEPPVTTSGGLIGRVKELLLNPKSEWAKIDAEPMTTGGIMTGWVAPLAAIPAIAGVIGMLTFGFGWLGAFFTPPIAFIVTNAVTGYVMAFVGVFVLSLIIDALAPSFGAQKNPVQALKVAAFSMTPGWIGGILAIVPMLAILGLLFLLYNFYLFFVGLPMLMKAPADKAVGYAVVTIIVAIVVFFIIGWVASAITWTLAPPIAPGAALRLPL